MKRKIVSILALVFVGVMLLGLPVSAAKSFQTYTYSLEGQALYSPDAYTAIKSIDYTYMNLSTNLDDPRDLFVDENDNVYIADSSNNRVIALDKYFKLKFIISEFVNDQGIPDSLNTPGGLYVINGIIYIADTNQNRIVTFDTEGNFLQVIPEPESQLFDTGSVYKPVALTVDDFGRLYVVSSTTYQGVIVMDPDGTFIRFIGAQKVTVSAWAKFWQRFQTEEQKALTASNISTEYNNIDMTKDGFMYITTSTIEDSKVVSAIKDDSPSGDFLPVKMLNKSGEEVMRRNGFWPPAGEIDLSGSKTDGSIQGPSTVVDVAVGPENTWSIIDQKRSKVFTYDYDGNLLFAFGDAGNQLGNASTLKAITYMSDGSLLLLDSSNKNITVYERTEYGDILIQALANQNNRQYDRAIDDWTEILKRNSNFDVAYIGIGNALYRNGHYKEALEYYEASYYVEGWSSTYAELRKEWITKNVWVVPLVIVVFIGAIYIFFRWAGKVNKRAETSGTKRTFGEELLFGFHLIFHPFDGFWDMKHEKRGSVRASLVYIIVTLLVVFYQEIGSGYLVNPEGKYSSIAGTSLGVIVPMALWIVSNWCLTTLFEGEGSFKDIFMACSYSLLPLTLTILPTTIYSNFAIKTELDIINFINSIGLIWCFLLIFVGMMVVHDYSLSKNFVTTLGTVVAMGFIMFISILFTTLVGNIVSFITNIVVEINYRL